MLLGWLGCVGRGNTEGSGGFDTGAEVSTTCSTRWPVTDRGGLPKITMVNLSLTVAGFSLYFYTG